MRLAAQLVREVILTDRIKEIFLNTISTVDRNPDALKVKKLGLTSLCLSTFYPWFITKVYILEEVDPLNICTFMSFKIIT